MIVLKDEHETYLATGAGLIDVTGDGVSVLTDLQLRRTALTSRTLKKRGDERKHACGRNCRTKKWYQSMPR